MILYVYLNSDEPGMGESVLTVSTDMMSLHCALTLTAS